MTYQVKTRWGDSPESHREGNFPAQNVGRLVTESSERTISLQLCDAASYLHQKGKADFVWGMEADSGPG